MPISHIIFHRNSNFTNILFFSQTNSNNEIATQFCTWDDNLFSWNMYSCDIFTRNGITTKWNFHRTLIVVEQYSDIMMVAMASRLFTQLFVQAQIKENIKALRHWALWGEFTGPRCEQSTQFISYGYVRSIMWFAISLNASPLSIAYMGRYSGK